MADIYLPNDQVDGRIVIASVWLRDTEPPITHLTLELQPFSQGVDPNYRVVEYELKNGEWQKHCVIDEFLNIVPAVECYVQSGGDY